MQQHKESQTLLVTSTETGRKAADRLSHFRVHY